VDPTHRPFVLVADDDDGVRNLMQRMLTLLGSRVLAARGGREAIDLFRQHQAEIGLVLLDVRMPDLTGPEALDAIRRIDPSARCWFVTGDPAPYTRQELIDRGAEGVLMKPFRLDDLGALVAPPDAGP
jgi:two-component system, cell cycle sensor histidine kinase and response regulator CckA